jgi:hypothetical protein
MIVAYRDFVGAEPAQNFKDFNARPYRAKSSPARIPIPPHIGSGRLPTGNEARIRSAGTATKAIGDSCSSAADKLQAVQLDLGQPRPERAATGDQHAEHTVLAQGNLEIVEFAEHRRDAARHFLLLSSPR